MYNTLDKWLLEVIFVIFVQYSLNVFALLLLLEANPSSVMKRLLSVLESLDISQLQATRSLDYIFIFFIRNLRL